MSELVKAELSLIVILIIHVSGPMAEAIEEVTISRPLLSSLLHPPALKLPSLDQTSLHERLVAKLNTFERSLPLSAEIATHLVQTRFQQVDSLMEGASTVLSCISIGQLYDEAVEELDIDRELQMSIVEARAHSFRSSG